jgi:uncharacterized SAM-binding protein YcdF (DUF218 family)
LRSRTRSILILAALVAALGALAAYGVANAARWLDEPDSPRAADAIVVLAGSYARPLHAAELYLRGLAPVVYVSVPAPDPQAAALAALGVRLAPKEEIYEQTLRAKGVPARAIRRLGSGSLSTYDEAQAARATLARRGATLLVVTSPLHVRRARMIFADALEGSGTALAVLAAREESVPARWWTSQDAAREVLLEWAKILFYLLGGRFRA